MGLRICRCDYVLHTIDVACIVGLNYFIVDFTSDFTNEELDMIEVKQAIS